MIQSLEIGAKIQGGKQREKKTDSRLWNCTRKSENRKKKCDYGCTWCTGRTLYCEHGRKSYRCDRDRPWTGQCICKSLYGCGLVQVEELGTLETPIALTNTLNVGKVWDALVDIVIEQCQNDGLEPMSINPVVGECNDCRINQIQKRAVGEKEVRQAFAAASEEFEEGDVGSGSVKLWCNRRFYTEWRSCRAKNSGMEAGKG